MALVIGLEHGCEKLSTRTRATFQNISQLAVAVDSGAPQRPLLMPLAAPQEVARVFLERDLEAIRDMNELMGIHLRLTVAALHEPRGCRS